MFNAGRKQKVKGDAQTLSGKFSPYRTGATSVRTGEYAEVSVNSSEALWTRATEVSFSSTFPNLSHKSPVVLRFFCGAVMQPPKNPIYTALKQAGWPKLWKNGSREREGERERERERE